MEQARRLPDEEAVKAFSEKMWGNITGAMTMSLCYLGEQLGLYRSMARGGIMSSAQVAEDTGLHERWVREWLYQQACAGLITYEEDGRFSLEPEAIEVLANDESLFFSRGSLTTAMALMQHAPNLKGSFQTGIGFPYDALGLDCAIGLEQMGGRIQREKLVTEILPLLDNMIDELQSGILVADVGCGSGTATMVMARAFPASEFHGFDTSKFALGEAQRRSAELELDNLFWHDATTDPLPTDSQFDFVTTFDVVHDTTNPAQLIDAIYRTIKPDGTWLITDITGRPSFEENMADHPLAATLYGFSVLLCMSSGMSEPGGAGLGTVGFHEDLAREMTAAAGFTRFRRLDYDDIFNNRYEVRP